VNRRYSLSRKEGWRRYVDDPSRTPPERLTPAQLAALSPAARDGYDEARHDWHPNLGIVRTQQLDALHAEIGQVVASNRQDSDRMRGVVAIDALPGLGKTTIANTYARQFDRQEVARLGGLTSDGHERIPVFRVGLSANTTLRTLNEKICQFYAHPAVIPGRRGFNADQLADFALDCVLACQTKLAIIDDIHFINPRCKDGLDVTNHLKYLNSEFPVTFVYVGVQLAKKGFFSEGATGPASLHAQTGRRWTRLEVAAFEVSTETGRLHWRSLLKATERQLVLTRAQPGMLVSLSDYLFARTSGHIGSFFSLISRGCYRAIRSGTETLTQELLDSVRIDEAAEHARRELAAAFSSGRLRSSPRRVKVAVG
jgi:hypothetical protein